jgi:hypothetical protein
MPLVCSAGGAEGGVQRGKPLYAERLWTQVYDELVNTGAKAVSDLSRARVRVLRAALNAQSSDWPRSRPLFGIPR